MKSAILLSAGLSSRFGSPKALAPIFSTTAILHLLKNFTNSQVDEIIIVLGAQADQIKASLLKHKMIKVVYNKDYNFGQTSSFKVGLTHASSQSKALLLIPVDYPFISTATIDLLIKEYDKNPKNILIPTFNGRKGHPPIFPISLKQDLLNLDDTLGVNTILKKNEKVLRFFEVNDPGVVQTFNTPEELEALKQSL